MHHTGTALVPHAHLAFALTPRSPRRSRFPVGDAALSPLLWDTHVVLDLRNFVEEPRPPWVSLPSRACPRTVPALTLLPTRFPAVVVYLTLSQPCAFTFPPHIGHVIRADLSSLPHLPPCRLTVFCPLSAVAVIMHSLSQCPSLLGTPK